MVVNDLIALANNTSSNEPNCEAENSSSQPQNLLEKVLSVVADPIV